MKRTITFMAAGFMLLGTAIMAQNTMNEPYLKQNTSPAMQKLALHKHLKVETLLQEYDSIYSWNIDTSTAAWAMPAVGKEVNFVYDANGNILSKVVMKWSGSAWVNSYQTISVYNGNNEQTSYISQNWNGTTFVNSEHQLFTYNANNDQTGDDYQTWTGSVWQYTSRDTFGYDVNNNLICEIYQNWNGTGWTNKTLYTYVLNAHNVVASDTTETWSGSAWTYVSLDNNTFDANNNYLTNISQSWTGSAWLNSSMDHYMYDVGNHEIADTNWQWSGSAWIVNNAYAYIYNAANKETGYSYADYIGSSWVKQGAAQYTYDANNFNQSYESKIFKNGGPGVNYGDSVYYYYHTVLGINTITSNKGIISVYPNPSKGKFNVICDLPAGGSQSIRVFNILGENVMTEPLHAVQGDNLIDLSNQPGGIYFYRVIGNSGELIGEGKLVIEK